MILADFLLDIKSRTIFYKENEDMIFPLTYNTQPWIPETPEALQLEN